MNTIIIDGLSFALPLFIMAIGGIYCERSGITNLAIEGLQGFGAFTGALFIIKPGLDFSQTFPAIVAFIGGMGAGCAAACIRKVRTFHVNGMVIIAFFSAFSTLIALPFSIIYFEPMSIQQLLWLCGTGVFAAFGQFGLTGAFYNAPAYKISVYDYSNIVFAAVLGFIFLDQVPDQWSLIGYVIIIGAAVAVFLRDLKKHQ